MAEPVKVPLEITPQIDKAKAGVDNFLAHTRRRVEEIHGLINRMEERAAGAQPAGRGTVRTARTIEQKLAEISQTGAPEREVQRLFDRYNRMKNVYTDLDQAMSKTDKALEGFEKRATRVPSYLGTVINSVGQAAAMFANLYRAQTLAFDLTSAGGMANAVEQYNITRTRELFGGGFRIAGAIGGGILGAMLGGVGGALGGSYLGGQIIGQIGEVLGIGATAQQEKGLKLFNQMYSRSQANVQGFWGVQNSLYTAGRRSGIDPQTLAKMMTMFTSIGVGPSEAAQALNLYLGATGGRIAGFDDYVKFQRLTRADMASVMNLAATERITGRQGSWGAFDVIAGRLGMNASRNNAQYVEFMQQFPSIMARAGAVVSNPNDIWRAGTMMAQLPGLLYGAGAPELGAGQLGGTPQGREQIMNLFNSIMTPRNQAQNAFLFSAIRRANPRASMLEMQLRMREGIMGEGNLEAVLTQLAGLPKNLRDYYLLAMTEGTNVNVGQLRDMMKNFGGFGGRLGRMRNVGFNGTGMFSDLENQIPYGEKRGALIEASGFEAGRSINDLLQRGVIKDYALNFERWNNYLVGTVDAQRRIQGYLEAAEVKLREILSENGVFIGTTDTARGTYSRSGPGRHETYSPRLGESGIMNPRFWGGKVLAR